MNSIDINDFLNDIKKKIIINNNKIFNVFYSFFINIK